MVKKYVKHEGQLLKAASVASKHMKAIIRKRQRLTHPSNQCKSACKCQDAYGTVVRGFTRVGKNNKPVHVKSFKRNCPDKEVLRKKQIKRNTENAEWMHKVLSAAGGKRHKK